MPSSSLEVRELNHVALHVKDLERSVRFYRDVLELKPIPRPNFDFPGAWFALGRQELHLIVASVVPGKISGHLALRVEDVRAAHMTLQAKGFTDMRPPAPRPDGVLQLFLRDPDGHLLELMSETDGVNVIPIGKVAPAV